MKFIWWVTVCALLDYFKMQRGIKADGKRSERINSLSNWFCWMQTYPFCPYCNVSNSNPSLWPNPNTALIPYRSRKGVGCSKCCWDRGVRMKCWTTSASKQRFARGTLVVFHLILFHVKCWVNVNKLNNVVWINWIIEDIFINLKGLFNSKVKRTSTYT